MSSITQTNNQPGRVTHFSSACVCCCILTVELTSRAAFASSQSITKAEYADAIHSSAFEDELHALDMTKLPDGTVGLSEVPYLQVRVSIPENAKNRVNILVSTTAQMILDVFKP